MTDRFHNKIRLKDRRKALRRSLTPAEGFLWSQLKNSNLAGRKFRRQHSIGNYILDFYCDAESLAVELDGEVHKSDRAIEHDRARTLYLVGLGIKVIRFENYLVFQESDYVLHRIESFFGWQDRP
ncbi:MAG: endonuclease domain-containing protein [Acidobacteriota bacterium]